MEETGLTPGEMIAILTRRKSALALPFFIISVAAVAVAFLIPAVYRSTSTILIEQREIPAEYVTSSITTFAEQRMQSINQRILTSSKLQELIRQYGLYTELEKKKTTDEIIEKMRNDIHLKPVNVEIADRRSGRTATATIAFTLSYEGKDPAKVQRVANTITSLFLKEDIKVRKEQASSAYDFLVTEAERVQQQIKESEKRLAAYKKEHVNALPELFQLNRRSLDSIETGIDRAHENLRALREKKEMLEEELAYTAVYIEDTDVQKEQKYQDEKRLELLKMELIELKTKFSDLYPDVKKRKQEIAALSKKVEASQKEKKEKQKNPAYITLSSRLAGLKSDIGSVKNQIADSEKQASEFRQRLAATPGVEEKYNALIMERNNQTIKYRDLQVKMMEANVAREFESKQKGERFTLVESARLPEKPYKPNRLAIALIGIVLGIGSGIGLAAVLEFSDSSFRNAESLSRGIGFPVLAEIPVIITEKDKKKQLFKRLAVVGALILVVIFGAYIFDQYVMDFDVFKARLARKLS